MEVKAKCAVHGVRNDWPLTLKVVQNLTKVI